MWDIEERCSCDNCAYHHDCTRKIDHDIVQLYAPPFATISTLPKGLICTEYYPAEWCVYKRKCWEGFDAYWEGYLQTWGSDLLKNPNKRFTVYLHGERWKDDYEIPFLEWVFGKPFDKETGLLKATHIRHWVRTRKSPEYPLGGYYKYIRINGWDVYNMKEWGTKER